jgi:hypothetical protein
MKKRIGLTIAVGLVASLASMHAAPIACPMDTTLQFLITASGVGSGCTVADKIFNDFAWIPGGGAPPATMVQAHLDDNLATLLFGWSFTSETGAFDGNWELKYDVSVITSGAGSCPTCTIVAAAEQMFPGTTPIGPQAISVNEGGGSPPIVMLNNLSFGGNTNGNLFVPGVVMVSKDATATGISSAFPLISFESDVRQVNTIPEPVTLSLMGISLLGLSFIGWRRVQK